MTPPFATSSRICCLGRPYGRNLSLPPKNFWSEREPQSPGCLVLDVRLPGTSGLELQKRLVAQKDRIPIIFISGYGDIPMAVQIMKAGAVDFLQKPFREQELAGMRAGGVAQGPWPSAKTKNRYPK